MTRFARGRGSKASNERQPEDATLWSEIKGQLTEKEETADLAIKRKNADDKRRVNYHKFLAERADSEDNTKFNTWSDFPNVASSVKLENEEFEADTKKKKPFAVSTGEQKKVMKKKEKMLRQLEKRKLKALQTKDPPVELDKKGKAGTAKKWESSPKLATFQNGNNYIGKTKQNGDNQSKATTAKKFTKFQLNEGRIKDYGSQTVIINGQTIELIRFDGFPIMKNDAEVLKELRKQMINKGLSHTDVNAIIKLQRRRAEKALSRLKKNVCYNCRKAGHVLSACPEVNSESNVDTVVSGVCFKCGSTEHTSFVCKVVQNQEFRFANCFICKQPGHISWQCPDNPRGLYPRGGACNSCGDVTHLRKDCPKYVAEQEETSFNIDTLQTHSNPEALDAQITRSLNNGQSGVNKIIKF